MDEVKDSKREIKTLEQRAKEMRKLEDIAQKKLRKINQLLSGDNTVGNEQKMKYEVLFAREKEVDEAMV